MEYQKILNLLNEADDSKFVTREWNIFNDQSNANYDLGNEFIYKTEVLWSNICGRNDTYILQRRDITIIGHQVTKVAFTNCEPFIKYITKIDGLTIDGVEDLDLVMAMYNLIEYNSNLSETTVSLWFYSKDETTSFNADIAHDNSFKFFKHKTKLLKLNRVLKNVTIAAQLKYLSNFWRSLETSLINFLLELNLKWTKYCVLIASGADNNDANSNNIFFTMKDTKLYDLVVTLLAKVNQNLSKTLSNIFKKLVYSNEFKVKIRQTNINIFSNQIL